MAGASVPWLMGILEALLRQYPGIQVVDYVIGDWPSFRWATSQRTDPRMRTRYQHEYLQPFQSGQPRLDRLVQLEERYGLPNLWRYIQAQRMIDHLSDAKKLAYLQAYLEYFESLHHKTQAELFITGTPDSLPFMAAAEVFRRNGCPTIAIAPGRLPKRIFFVQNELEQIRGLAEAYAEVKSRPMTDAETRTVQVLRADYVKRRIRPSYYRLRPNLAVVPSPLRLVSVLRRRLLDDDRYFDFALWEYIKRSVLFRLREPIQRWALQRYQSRRIEHDRFFYMPLNYEPECSIDVQSGVYRDQISVVERVVDGLPAGYILYVKEHPNMLPGARPCGFYQRMVNLGFVRILPREMDSYEILPRCAGVITIGGTTGIEALFYGKPVLLFGHAFYEVFQEGVFQASEFEAIPLALRHMADAPSIDETMFDRFVIAVLSATYAGASELTIPGATDPANYEAIAEAIAQEIQSLGTRHSQPVRSCP